MKEISSEILKPGRYINKEWNSAHKKWSEDILKIALCFPDIYEVGMSHLGLKILYEILNNQEGILCERAFAPWPDMEKAMRDSGEKLFSLESGRQLKDFDIIGFSLQYEMNFSDVLNIMDMGGIPVYSDRRSDNDPLVIAGGPCSFNPAVMSRFIDIFVVGEAEEVILEIIEAVKDYKLKYGIDKGKLLKEISRIDGIYIPTISHTSSIKKRIVKDLDGSCFPLRPVVPYIQIVHDRIGIEIMRGCPHRCKFCQACKIFQPLRLRSSERVLEIAEESIRNTGYDEISLLSLSSGDYPNIDELVARLQERFKGKGIKVSLPSLRVKSFHPHSEASIMKRAGLTFAPESGSDILRKKLNKNIENRDIIEKSRLAFKYGWRKVKLYFMVGLPEETERDLDAILELASQVGRSSLSISPFIPKPHSEFEDYEMDALEALIEKQNYLRKKCNERKIGKRIRMNFHSPYMSMIEGVLSRGDSNIGRVVYRVWKQGGRFQAWDEHFDYKLWIECFQAEGIDPKAYLGKPGKSACFPWSFIVLK